MTDLRHNYMIDFLTDVIVKEADVIAIVCEMMLLLTFCDNDHY